MTLSRAATGLSGVLFTMALSVGPPVIPWGPGRAAPTLVAPASAERPIAPAWSIRVAGPAPADVTVEVEEAAGRLVVRRPGYLVAVRTRDARAAGADWAALGIQRAPREAEGAATPASLEVVWESTPLEGAKGQRPVPPATVRGLLTLAREGGVLRAVSSLADPPEPAGRWLGRHHACAAQRDGLGGFTVLCRFDDTARHVAAANVTGAHPLADAWVTSGRAPLARLELPAGAGVAQGRLIGFSAATMGTSIHASATFVEGEPAAVTLFVAERAQPISAASPPAPSRPR